MGPVDYRFRKVPDYYPTMYMDGFTPVEIHYAHRKKWHKEIEQQKLKRRIAELERLLKEKDDDIDINIHIK